MQGPFNLDNESSVYIKKDNNIDYPLSIYFETRGKHYKVESYAVDGGFPNVETVFFC